MKELSTYKILPFDLYSESNAKILGDKNSSRKSSVKKLSNFSYDSIDISEFETVINKDNSLKAEVQVKIKYYFRKTLDLFQQGYFEEGLLKLNSLVNVIITDVYKQLNKSKKGSQIRFLGEYEICHPINVGIISGLIAKKLELTNLSLENVVLAGILHDIGKLKIKLEDGNALLTTHEDEVAEHTKLGYNIIKNELHLSEDIAKGALEHHENNDGSGYPQGLSSDYISELAQIINVANYYDNLASNRTPVYVSSNRDALRAMLEVGSKRFSARMLYTFVHMFNYDDPKEFNDMII